MNLTQKQTILNSIETILSFDFDKLIIDNNASGNVDEIKFGDFSVTEFKNNYIKVFTQLKDELESGLALMLPNQENFNNEFSSVTLDTESSNFNTYLSNFENRNAAAEILRRFIYYQIRQGFWNKSTIKPHNPDVEKLKQAQDNLILAEKILTQNIKVFEGLKTDLTNKIAAFEAILQEKNEQSTQLTALLNTAQTNSASIESLLLSSKQHDSQITTLDASIKSKLDMIEFDISTYKGDFDKIKQDNQVLMEELNTNIETAKGNLDDSKTGNDFIQNQRELITKLIGMAADGTLGYKFNDRKEELQKSMKYFWQYAVPGSIIVALIWVYLVFTKLSANFDDKWIDLIINLVKTSPAWILVGFVFSQYSNERHLQEEYAFKSAIAMTLTSYSQMLPADDASPIEIRSSKQEMLLKAIENLYTQPKLKIEKGEKSDIVNTKQFVESVKSLADLVKSVKS